MRSVADYSLGQKIRQYRQERGLTLEELAKRIGISYSFLSAIERNQKRPSLSTIRRIGEALNVPLSYLLAPTGSTVAEKLRLIREGRALSLEDLAEATGIAAELLRRYEAGEAAPSLKELELLSDALDVTVRYFLDSTPGSLGLGRRLAEAREKAGLTLTELAARVGVSVSLLSQIEHDKVVPSLDTLERLAQALGISVCYFLMEQEEVKDLLSSLSPDVLELLRDPRVQGVLRAVRDFSAGELRFLLNWIEYFRRYRHLLR